MKKWLLVFLAMPIAFIACKKGSAVSCTAVESTVVASTVETDSIQHFLDSNSITAIKLPSGVFYRIDSTGSGKLPGICSAIAVKYAGYFMGNPVSFESVTDSAGTVFTLSDVIVGWQKVFPFVNAGGKATLYIPPSLAYGPNPKRNADGDVIIPGNSYLVFNIELVTVY